MLGYWILLVCAAVVVAWHLASNASPSPGAWGVHHYGFLPRWWLLVGLGTGALGFAAGAFADRITPKRLGLFGVAALLALSGALFWAGRESTTFLGDGGMWVQGIRRGVLLWHNEPLSLIGQYAVNRALGSPDPAISMGIVSVVCGLGFLVAALLFARGVSEERGARGIVFGILATAGLTRLFYGYVEVYALLVALTAFYCVAADRYLRGEERAFPMVILALLAPAFHTTGLFLLPSLAYALWVGPLGQRDGRGRRLAWLFLYPAAFISALWILGFRPDTLVDTYRTYLGKFLPWSGDLNLKIPYRLFDLAHLRNFLQEQLILGPFAALAAFASLAWLTRDRMGPSARFFLWAGVPWWIFSFAYNREIGAARDWDLFAAASVPFLFFFAYAFARHPWRWTSRGRALAGAVLAANALHLAGWVAVDAFPRASIARFATLHGPGSDASPFARSYAYEELGLYYLDHKDPLSASAAFFESVHADSSNARAFGTLGATLVALGQTGDAFDALRAGLERNPENAYLFYQLGMTHRRAGQTKEAILALEKSVQLDPKDMDAILNLVVTHRQAGNLERAQIVLQEAIARYPNDARLYAHLGQVEDAGGNWEAALVSYRKALEIDPSEASAGWNLGRLLMQRERYEEAREIFEKLVVTSPDDYEAWINLGVVRQSMNLPIPATDAYRRALAIDPARHEAFFNLSRMCLAAGDTVQARELLLRYAATDSTSQYGDLARKILGALGPGAGG